MLQKAAQIVTLSLIFVLSRCLLTKEVEVKVQSSCG